MSKKITSILPEPLKTFEYYVKKCPIYLRNDENFLEHFRIWYDFLMGDFVHRGIYPSAETILSLMNVFDTNYLDIINSLEGDIGSDMLDKLGSIFNIRRNFSVNINNVVHEISLADDEFLLFIKAQIIKNYSNGSYYQMREFYDKAGLLIYFNTTTSGNTTAYLLSLSSSADIAYSNNIKDLFLAGLLTIESMGINYMYNIQPYDKMLIWVALDAPDGWDGKGWDEGEWIL